MSDKQVLVDVAIEQQFRFALWQLVLALPLVVSFVLLSSLAWGVVGCFVSVLLLVNAGAIVTMVRYRNWIRLIATWACSAILVYGFDGIMSLSVYEFLLLVAATFGLAWGAGLRMGPRRTNNDDGSAAPLGRYLRGRKLTIRNLLRVGGGVFFCLSCLLLCVGGVGMIERTVLMQQGDIGASRVGIDIPVGVGQVVLGVSGTVVGAWFISLTRSATQRK